MKATDFGMNCRGDYYIPCLTLPTEKENKPIGLWGTATQTLFTGMQESSLHHATHKWQIEQLSC